ncbi:pyridoxal phosphate-dependent transferase [Clohesyomyces aquaticus]|uniref:Pyridoxal phosphate-dependent transferase n=1 Tax=Clohesyomyces aquaticus TaxID=1231657 RepID=A0A1Y1ZEE9_9PLEO|nr:pyridoxal phosphate-dependent transferase [Clohesyomyces aquaticus]
MANFINRYFHPYKQVDPDDLTFANGCVSIFNMLGLILGDPGDGIMFSMPSYIALPGDFGILAKLKTVYVPFHSTSQFTPSCIATYSAAYTAATNSGTRIRALLLCNPHNPLGQCYPAETLIALMRFCDTHDIHLIADEIYAQSVYTVLPDPLSSDPFTTSPPSPTSTPTPFTSILSLNTTAYIRPAYLHFLYGLSKDFACGGLRLGVLYTQNKDLFRAVSCMNQFHWSGTIDCTIAATILEDEVWLDGFLETSRKRLGESNGLARALLRGLGVEYQKGGNAGFFLWVDLRRWLGGGEGDGWDKEERLTERLVGNKVFLTGGRRQGSEKPGWYRLVFSHEEGYLREGFRRLGMTLKEVEGEMEGSKRLGKEGADAWV